MSKSIDTQKRERDVKSALWVLILSVAWILIEAVASGMAAVQGGSLAMSAFSVDSAVELVSGLVVLSRIWREFQVGDGAESANLERFASAVVGACLFVLAAFIAFKSGQALAVRTTFTPTPLGTLVAAASSLITPWLALRKRQLGAALHSHALLGDAACSFTCAYMAWTLLAGQLLAHWFGWWWIDAVSAVGILYFVLREAFDSAHAAWTGEAHVH